MNNYKIRVNNEAESREAQELFFELGYRWNYNGKTYFEVSSREILAYSTGVLFQCGKSTGEELTLPQLRDLVAQSKYKVREYLDPERGYMYIKLDEHEFKENMLGNEKWIEIPESAVMALKHHDSEDIFFQNTYPIGMYVTRPKLVWDRQSIQKQGLISGADALRALADGKEVEVRKHKEWNSCDIAKATAVDYFINDYYEFRLKPRTVKLEIEVPAPFEPKVGDEFFYLNDGEECGYVRCIHDWGFDPKELNFGAWRTEANIKIVVEQLRKLKEHSK